MFQAEPYAVIEDAMPQLLQLLVDGNWEVRVAGANIMAKLAEHGEFLRISSFWHR
jgi:hypothetical protein